MPGYSLSPRAFRFAVGSRQFALDIQANQVFDDPTACMYELQPGGAWHMKWSEWGEPNLVTTDATITAAGGVVPFCRLIVERANHALAALFGGGTVDPPANLIEEVQAHLAANLRVIYVDGKPRLSL